MSSENVVWHHATVTRKHREERNGHRGSVIWFTGLSGSGKSTLAHALEDRLFKQNYQTYVLDGDNVRHGLCGDLGFSESDRGENIRRIGEIAKLFSEAGIIVLTAFISPFKQDRELVRRLLPHGDFHEVYCQAPLEICEERDVKGMYRKARKGLIKDFTGISSPYESPVNPELIVNTSDSAIDVCVDHLIDYLRSRSVIKE